MKKITILLCCLVTAFGFSQTDLETFEGTPPTIAVANATAGTSAAIVADPTGGGNGNVLEFITGDAGDPWQQAELTFQDDFLDLTPGIASTMTIDVYSLEAFDVLVRVTDGAVSSTDGTAVADSAADAIHTGSGWETLTFDFDDPQDGQATGQGIYGRIFIFNLWDANDAGSGPGGWSCDPFGAPEDACPMTTRLYDNFNGTAASAPETCSDGILNNGEEQIDCGGPNCDPCPSLPTEAAPEPPFRAAANVRSIYSDAYTNIAIDSYDVSFCPATTTEVVIEGNPTQQITGLGCEGIEFISGRFDATEFPFFHMDIWTDSNTMDKSFNFKFSDWQGGGGEVGAFEYSMTNASSPVALPNPNPGTWISIDLNLSDFTVINAVDGSDFVQFVITSDLGTVYYDNLYLHNNNLSVDEFATNNFKVYPNPTVNNWTISGTNTINRVNVYDILGKQVIALTPNANEAEVDASSLNTGVYFARIEGINGSKTVKLIKE